MQHSSDTTTTTTKSMADPDPDIEKSGGVRRNRDLTADNKYQPDYTSKTVYGCGDACYCDGSYKDPQCLMVVPEITQPEQFLGAITER